jgi:hypothetical protein
VRNRLLDHSMPVKAVAQCGFQRGDFPFFHDWTGALIQLECHPEQALLFLAPRRF